MKKLFLSVVLTLTSATSFATSIMPHKKIVAPLQVVKVERNHMFPVETVTLTYMKPCGTSVVGKIVEHVENKVVLGVLGETIPAQAVCLALPSEVEETFSLFSETPLELIILNKREIVLFEN